jgi:hypothetical protein
MYPILARLVIRGRDNPAPLPLCRIGPHHKREPSKCRRIPLLNRGIERVHIDVCNDSRHQTGSGFFRYEFLRLSATTYQKVKGRKGNTGWLTQIVERTLCRTAQPSAMHNRCASIGNRSLLGCDLYRTLEKSASNSLVFPSGKNTTTFVLALGSKLS